MDVGAFYPLEFYQKSAQEKDSKSVARIVDLVSHRLGTSAQYQSYYYTHSTSNINQGNNESVYKQLKSMEDKMNAQLLLSEKIMAVDVKEVAKRILTSHLIRDIVGNMRAFSTQNFRCKHCNTKFRRIPLNGKCNRCGGDLVLTVYRGAVAKYIEITEEMAKKYGVHEYYQQRIALIREDLESLFQEERKKVVTLQDFI
jgi:DNA polymerase II large subunit